VILKVKFFPDSLLTQETITTNLNSYFKDVVNYSIERICPGNIKNLQVLYRAAFRKTVSLEFLLQKYDTKFSGAEFIGYIAFAPDRSPAAFYGVLPCLFRLSGQAILAAQSADTMTHPDHRRQGLFVRLAQQTYILAKEYGIELIFGFPNEHSLAGFVKLNWMFQPEPMKLFKIRANPFPFSKIISSVPFIKDLYIRLLERKYHVENKGLAFSDDLQDGIIKNTGFLNYKKYSKTFFIEIDGVPVWIKLDSTLKIGCVSVSKIQSVGSFIQKLKKIAIQSGCSQIIFMTREGTPLFKMLYPLAQPEDSFPIGFYSTGQQHPDFANVQFEYCDIDIF